MKHFTAISASLLCFALPVNAQDTSTLDRLFNLLEQFSDETQPMVEDLFTEIAPKLDQLQSLLTDWSLFEAPEVLPNGDIIIRRKQDIPTEPNEPFQKEPRDI